MRQAEAEALEAQFGIRIRAVTPVGGGDIARAYRLETSGDMYFLKMLEGETATAMLRAEAEGLRALAETRALGVPSVLGVSEFPGGAALLMEFINASGTSKVSGEALGRGLAQLHGQQGKAFGWASDNFIGSLPQTNGFTRDWTVFYAGKRLAPQYRLARNNGLLQGSEVPGQAAMEARIRDLMPSLTPSLLHGDLWGGNYLIAASGEPYLIDPAVYYGHREVDLAMTRLFGGFPDSFYAAYCEICPPEHGHDLRQELYQLYYLLVHLNLFGRSYYPAVRSIGKRLFGLA